jgi:hypothetical protein
LLAGILFAASADVGVCPQPGSERARSSHVGVGARQSPLPQGTTELARQRDRDLDRAAAGHLPPHATERAQVMQLRPRDGCLRQTRLQRGATAQRANLVALVRERRDDATPDRSRSTSNSNPHASSQDARSDRRTPGRAGRLDPDLAPSAGSCFAGRPDISTTCLLLTTTSNLIAVRRFAARARRSGSLRPRPEATLPPARKRATMSMPWLLLSAIAVGQHGPTARRVGASATTSNHGCHSSRPGAVTPARLSLRPKLDNPGAGASLLLRQKAPASRDLWLAMPPLPHAYLGRDAIGAFLRGAEDRRGVSTRLVPTRTLSRRSAATSRCPRPASRVRSRYLC